MSQSRARRFEEVAAEVFEPLQRYIKRRIDPDLAEDVLADVMLTVWRRLDDIPTDRTLPWCYGVARRALANQHRSNRRHLRLVERLGAQPPETVPDPGEAGADPDLAAALEAMAPDDRELLRLWAWERLEPREIAVVLGVSVNAATLRLSRARKRLRASLAGQTSTSPGHESVEGTQEKR